MRLTDAIMKLSALVLVAFALFTMSPALSSSVTPFGPTGGAFTRQMFVDGSGDAAYYFEPVSGGFQLYKTSLSSATILATGTTFTITATYLNSGIIAPIGGYTTATKLWVQGTNGSAQEIMYSFDGSTLAHVDSIVVTNCGGTSDYTAATNDGSVLASYNDTFDGICLFNTGTHNFASYTFAAHAGGPTSSWGMVFDAADELWLRDDNGDFWYYPVTKSSTPSLGNGVKFANATSGTNANLSYNPTLDTVYAWALTGHDFNVIPINATSHTFGTVNVLTNNGAMQDYVDYAAAQMRNWNTSGCVGVLNQDPNPTYSGQPGIPGIYTISSGVTTYYTWSTYFGMVQPGLFFSEMATDQVCDKVLGLTGGAASSPHNQENWLFFISSSGRRHGFLHSFPP